MDSMMGVAAAGLGVKFVTALVAFVMVWAMLRLFDHATGFNFRDWIDNASDTSASIYFAGRIVAACLLFGMVLS